MGINKYQLDSNALLPFSGRLHYITYSMYEGEWKSIRHSHSFAELFYVKSGKGTFLIEDKTFPIVKDDFIILNPNIEHTEISAAASPLEYITLGVEDLQFSFLEKEEFLLLNCASLPVSLQSCFTAILAEAEQKTPGYEPICQNLMELFCLYLNRYTQSASEIVSSRNTSRECSRIKRYIDSNYQEDLTLSSLANMAHLNKYYFVHAFTKFYGQSPMSYLTQRRIQVSRDLLSSSDFSISEIAQLSGFSSSSYFSQCFRRICGMTAGAYRKQKQLSSM